MYSYNNYEIEIEKATEKTIFYKIGKMLDQLHINIIMTLTSRLRTEDK